MTIPSPNEREFFYKTFNAPLAYTGMTGLSPVSYISVTGLNPATVSHAAFYIAALHLFLQGVSLAANFLLRRI